MSAADGQAVSDAWDHEAWQFVWDQNSTDDSLSARADKLLSEAGGQKEDARSSMTSTQSAHAEATERSKKVIKNPFAMMDDSVLLMDEVELSNSKVELLVNPDEASPADLAKTAWAFAVCRQHHGGLLTKLARRLTAHPHGWWLSGKDVSKLAWAYATLKKKSIKILNLNRKFHYET